MSRLNRWLILLLVAVVVKQGWFLATIPAWQVPDEPAHVAYVQAMIEQHRLPVFSDQGMDISQEMLRSLTAIENVNPHRLGRHYPPGFLQTPTSSDRRLTEAGQPIRNLAARNSPIYYAAMAIPYGLTYSASLEQRLFAMRVFSSLLLLIVVWLSVGMARRLSNNFWFSLAVGAVVGFHPAASLLFVGVNPDAGLTAVSTLALWLMIRPIQPGQLFKQAMMLAVVIGAAASLKSPGWFLLGPALVWWVVQRKMVPLRQWLGMGGAAAGIAGLVGSAWLLLEHFASPSAVIDFYGANNHPLSWQRVLNNDAFERPAIVFRTWWGHIGWSGVSRYNQEWVYGLMVILGLLAIISSVAILWHRRWRLSAPVVMLTIGAITLECFYQALYWRAGLLTGATHFPLHGRYYLPLLAPLSIFFVFGVSVIFPPKIRWVGYSLAVVSVVLATATIGAQALHLYSLERAAGWCFGMVSL